jgi:hypothetical protein
MEGLSLEDDVVADSSYDDPGVQVPAEQRVTSIMCFSNFIFVIRIDRDEI